MRKLSIEDWINQNPNDPNILAFRQAVHTILTAIAGTPSLQAGMIMKGGVLLALSYGSTRYTKDIDFSTDIQRPDFDLDAFRQKLEESLIVASENLGYGLDCRIQSCVYNPAREDATAPTIQVSVGYAHKGSRAHKRLQAGQVPTVIRIDYSLNEPVDETELFELEDGSVIHTYSLVEMVAEKFRALLQQEARNRVRRQDIYDIHYVLSDHPLREDPQTKARILERLIQKSHLRHLPVDPDAMANRQIRERTQAAYQQLATEIDGDLPPFDVVYALVEAFYRLLPWRQV